MSDIEEDNIFEINDDEIFDINEDELFEIDENKDEDDLSQEDNIDELDDIPEEGESDEDDSYDDEEEDQIDVKIIQKKERITFNILTKYEKNYLLGFRTQQIINGSPILININKLQIKTPYEIAKEELRTLPNGTIELWELEELIILE
jgi:DNA-directed RNA polymerase subunit K/omega